jgi:hypothetical protein
MVVPLHKRPVEGSTLTKIFKQGPDIRLQNETKLNKTKDYDLGSAGSVVYQLRWQESPREQSGATAEVEDSAPITTACD